MGLFFRGMCVAVGELETINRKPEKGGGTLNLRRYEFSDGKKAYHLTDWAEKAIDERFVFGQTYHIRCTEVSGDNGQMGFGGDPVED